MSSCTPCALGDPLNTVICITMRGAVEDASLCSREKVLSGAGMGVPLTTLCTSRDQSIELFQMRLALTFTLLFAHIVHTNLI